MGYHPMVENMLPETGPENTLGKYSGACVIDLKSPAVLVICPVHNMETIVSILFKSYSFFNIIFKSSEKFMWW